MKKRGMQQFKVVQCMCVYQYLKTHCVGKENAISGVDLCNAMYENHSNYFTESFNKVQLQEIVKHLRRNDIPDKYITRRIGSSPSGYWLETKNGVSISYFHQVLNELDQEKLVEGQTRIPLKPSQDKVIHVYSNDLLLD